MGHVAHVGKMRNEYNILVGKRREDNIRIDLREI